MNEPKTTVASTHEACSLHEVDRRSRECISGHITEWGDDVSDETWSSGKCCKNVAYFIPGEGWSSRRCGRKASPIAELSDSRPL